MRGIKIPQYEFALQMQGGLMREGGRICGTLRYFYFLAHCVQSTLYSVQLTLYCVVNNCIVYSQHYIVYS